MRQDAETLPEKRVGEDGHLEMIHDKDLVGTKTKESAMHSNHLTEEELELEKKLRRRIDSTIMPMVVLVSSIKTIEN